LLAGCATALGAQEPGQPPQLLLDSAHCLATAPGDLLEFSSRKTANVELGYVADARAYPGQELLTVVNYTDPIHTRGTVFRFLADRNSRQRLLHLLFSVGFRQSDDGSRQIQLASPPFGGVGTQDEILDAIRHIGFHTFSVPYAPLLLPSDAVQCTAESLP
jgi:hypothetical protein